MQVWQLCKQRSIYKLREKERNLQWNSHKFLLVNEEESHGTHYWTCLLSCSWVLVSDSSKNQSFFLINVGACCVLKLIGKSLPDFRKIFLKSLILSCRKWLIGPDLLQLQGVDESGRGLITFFLPRPLRVFFSGAISLQEVTRSARLWALSTGSLHTTLHKPDYSAVSHARPVPRRVYIIH